MANYTTKEEDVEGFNINEMERVIDGMDTHGSVNTDTMQENGNMITFGI